VVLTITVDSTEGEVLAVPVAALSVAADGTSRVEVQEADGTTRFVTVTPGLAAKGLVAVVSNGPLAAGDLVIVGVGATSAEVPTTDTATTDSGTITTDTVTTDTSPTDTTGSTNAP
jgi:multidrug efflux pump subunit AcrA (membrane-fusion protein)